MPYVPKVKVFDIVPYVTFNKHIGASQNCIAIWMRCDTVIEGAESDTPIMVHFAPLGKSVFVRTVQNEGIGFETELAYLVKEVKPADTQRKIKGRPPQGYDFCPERVQVVRPTIGGRFNSEVIAERRAAKIARRNANR